MTGKRKRASRGRKSASDVRFERRLALFNWMLELFGAASFDELADGMRDDPDLERFEGDGVSRYHLHLVQHVDSPHLPPDLLLAYDRNIVRHWNRITEKRNVRGQKLFPKYFQYLCLLFTEIYLHRFFNDPEKLCGDLNAYLQQFNAGATRQQKDAAALPVDARLAPYEPDELAKLAFWSATGSGKTLIMHVNILQYLHYLELHGREKKLNRIILLTPSEGLSIQHLKEFEDSGLQAALYTKDGLWTYKGDYIVVIDIHKLQDQSGKKTVAVDAFEGDNLVLVDEGHRGSSGGKSGQWLRMRNKLCEKGFSFEYSATFGQAMKAGSNRVLAGEYAKCIIFDYSYKHFYADGYGKDYLILNLDDDSNEEHRRRYLAACLLSFYQQLRIFLDKRAELRRFLIEKPLWIFVGHSVAKGKRKSGFNKDDKTVVSDVVDILLFLARFVKEERETVDYLDRLLKGNDSGLFDAAGRDLFARSFLYLKDRGFTGESVFRDILAVLFNAQAPGVLHVRRLKGGGEAEGEIALHLGGHNEPFGLVNVGDSAALCKLCEQHSEHLAVMESEFSESLFHRINTPDSSINVLIGSKKFSEGWSSWRVSTMGLMNIGKTEGAQIIQLFGRGVRLKGVDFCLKRSNRNPSLSGEKLPEYLKQLETLYVFGIRADYMREFKEYLEDEGVPAREERIEFVLPVVPTLPPRRLKTIRLKKGVDFKKAGRKPVLGAPDAALERRPVVLDWYPRIQALASAGGRARPPVATKHKGCFKETHVAFLDLDELYFRLERFKNERAWYNLNISREWLKDLLTDPHWYELYIPEDELEFRSFEQVRQWQEIAVALLCKYCDRYYKARKAEYERKHLECSPLTGRDGNFIDEYQFLLDASSRHVKIRLEEVKQLVEQIKDAGVRKVSSSKAKYIEPADGIQPIFFERHLYQPLIYVENKEVQVEPVPLNRGERDFVVDLQDFCERNGAFFRDKQLYLLRNMTRGRGIGFFEAGNFYPDFILWLVVGQRQYINFIDPKGLRNLEGIHDPKIAFHRTIKEIEADLRKTDPWITLNSFIISNTPLQRVSWWNPSSPMTLQDFEKHNVFFPREEKKDKGGYIEKLLSKALG